MRALISTCEQISECFDWVTSCATCGAARDPASGLVQTEWLRVDGLSWLLLGASALGAPCFRVERGHGDGEHQALGWQGHGRGKCGGALDAGRLPILWEEFEEYQKGHALKQFDNPDGELDRKIVAAARLRWLRLTICLI